MNNKTKTLLILIACLAINSLTGCATALHGPCKTLSVDYRLGYGKLGPDVCLTDRCLGWVVGRNNGPFHHLSKGTLDPGCGPNNAGSLIRGTQTLAQQWPGPSSGGLFSQQPTQAPFLQPQQPFQQQPFQLQQPQGQLLQQPPVIPQAFFDPFQQ